MSLKFPVREVDTGMRTCSQRSLADATDGDMKGQILQIDPAARQCYEQIRRALRGEQTGPEYDRTLGACIDRAIYDEDVSAIAVLSLKDAGFRWLQDALHGDRDAQSAVADAFMRSSQFTEASAFSIVAGKGPWQWHEFYRHYVDCQRRQQLVDFLRGRVSFIA